jgi:hypothetical protein
LGIANLIKFIISIITKQKVLQVIGAHAMFVTGLEFIPVTTKEALPISSDVEASVISFSVDNRICIHSLRYRREYFSTLIYIFSIF